MCSFRVSSTTLGEANLSGSKISGQQLTMRLPSTLKIPAQRAVSLLAAAVISTSSSFALPAIAAPLPTQVELLRLSEGLARVDQ